MFVLACLAVFTIFRFLDYPVASWQLNREYERAKKNGIPLTQAELKPKGIDEKQNAAPELVRIGRAIEAKDDLKDVPVASLAKANASICRNYLQSFYKANALSQYWADTDYDRGSLLEQPEMEGYRMLSRALYYLAKESSFKGRWKDSLLMIQNSIRLSKHLESSPGWYGQHSSRYILHHAFRTIEQLASDNSLDFARIQSLLDIVEKIEISDCTKQAILGDTYRWIATMRNIHWYGGSKGFIYHIDLMGHDPEKYGEPKVVAPIIRKGKPTDMISRALLAKHLAYINDAVDSREWTKNDFKGLAERMNRFSEQHDPSKTFRVSDRLNTILMPMFESVYRPYIAKSTRKKVVELLLRALLFRITKHSFPSDLRQISSDFSDPYQPEKNLHYRTDGKSVAIWSVGSNLVDDGGHKEKGNDIGAYYPAYKPIR